MNIFFYLCLLIACGLFAAAAVSDFRSWKIPNTLVLALVALYAVMRVGRLLLEPGLGVFSMAGLYGDLAAAGLLFVLGVALWIARMFGAGDAKLFFPIGLYIGWVGLMPFAIFLLVFGILALVLLKMPVPLQLQASMVAIRLDEIRKSRKVPYGVIMVASTFVTLFLRLKSGMWV